MLIHIFFIIVHICCLLFGMVGLIVSIPLHIIIVMMRGQKKKMEEQTQLLKEQKDISMRLYHNNL